MPDIPKIKVLTNTSDVVINTIRNNASQSFKDYVPYAEPNAESIKTIGNIIMDYPALQNEFLSALVNRIAAVLVTSKMYDDPLAFLKRGLMQFGETVEEVFVDIAAPRQFDPETAEEEVFKRVKPAVRSAFHPMNYQKFYKVTISNDQLKQAFLSYDGITDLISRITNSLYSGAAYDEFLMIRYLLARNILNNHLYVVPVDGVGDEAKGKATIKAIKAATNKLQFMSSEYNAAGVRTYTPPDQTYIFMTSDFESEIDVDVLASAFNIDRVTFMGRRVLVPSFDDLDNDRLKQLLENYPDWEPFTSSEIEKLQAIKAVVVDRDYFMIFDNLYQFTEQYNGQGLYWNYFYHVWKTFSVSPFMNALVFVDKTRTSQGSYGTPVLTYSNGKEIGDINSDAVLPDNNVYLAFNNSDTSAYDKFVALDLKITSDIQGQPIEILNGSIIKVGALDNQYTNKAPLSVTVQYYEDQTATIKFYSQLAAE